MAILVGVTLIFGTRTKFFYYCVAFSIDKSIISLFKMIYHEPRPFMASNNSIPELEIIPYSCSTEFGNPSGHSLSSALFSTMLFLDMFHDERKSFRTKPLSSKEI